MADDNLHLRVTQTLDSRDLARVSRGDVVPLAMDDVDDAFSEWDETTPGPQIAQGSQPHALPVSSRTTTLSDPVTTRRLAKASQRIAVPQRAPRTLEEALLALTDGLPPIADELD